MNRYYNFEQPRDEHGNVDGNRQISFDERALVRRKMRIEQYFEKAGIPMRLIGNPHKPAIIIAEAVCLSAYVSNFNLHFTDKPFDGNIIYTVKLHNDTAPDIDKLYQVILTSEHRQVYRIRYEKTDLYLAGYNFIDKKTSYGKYPVFARTNVKVYFDSEYASQIVKEFEGVYELVITQTAVDFELLYKNIKNGTREIYRQGSRRRH